MNESSKTKFLAWESASRDTIDVKRIYIDMAEDLVSGIMLSQLVYWHLPNRKGDSKLSVERDGHLWVAKAYSEWMYECRLSKKQARRAVAHLTELGLIVMKVYHFANKPSVHIRLNWDIFMEKFSYIVNNVNTPETVEKYWDEINLKDGRSASRLEENEVNNQKGNLPLSNFIPEVNTQKGTLQSDKKDTSCTEIVSEITSSKNFFADEPQTNPITSLVKAVEFTPTDLSTLTSKEEVLMALGRLVPYTIEADKLLGTLTTKDVANFKRDCQKHEVKCTCLHPYETLPYKIMNEITNILASGAVNWAVEGKHSSKLIRSLITLKYTMEDIIYCMAWAYQTGEFEYYAMSSTSVPKLMPKFLDLRRTGKLKDSLLLKPKETANDKRWKELQKNKEEILKDAAKASQELNTKYGITAKPRI